MSVNVNVNDEKIINNNESLTTLNERALKEKKIVYIYTGGKGRLGYNDGNSHISYTEGLLSELGDNVIISNNYTSSGTYYSQSGTQNIAPTETSAGNSNVYSLPVSGFANTNASDIDQRIYYTNTINLKTGLDMRLSDYVKDFDALAKYLRSSKVEFANIDDSDRKQVREYVNKTVQSKYVEQMRTADFRNEGVSSWPKIFSYRDTDGTVYFSVKLSSKLGNYAIVKYQQ